MEMSNKEITDVQSLYESFIIKNISSMFKYVKPMWLSPSEIKISNEVYSQLKIIDNGYDSLLRGSEFDDYVNDIKENGYNLGQDVLENGSYWHYVVRYDKDNGYVIREGAHRHASLLILMEKGIWPKNKKIFCLVYEERLYDTNPYGITNMVTDEQSIVRVSYNKSRNIIKWYSHTFTPMITNVSMVMNNISRCIYILRDIIYDSKVKITPLKELNDEKYKSFWDDIKDDVDKNGHAKIDIKGSITIK